MTFFHETTVYETILVLMSYGYFVVDHRTMQARLIKEKYCSVVSHNKKCISCGRWRWIIELFLKQFDNYLVAGSTYT